MSLNFNGLIGDSIDREYDRLFREILFDPNNHENYLDMCFLLMKRDDFSQSCVYFFGLLNGVPNLKVIERIFAQKEYREFFQSVRFPEDGADIALMKAFFLYLLDLDADAEEVLDGIIKENCLFNGFYFVLLQWLLFKKDDFEKELALVDCLLQGRKSKGLVNYAAGDFYDRYGDFKKAVRYYGAAIEIFPLFSDLYYSRGYLFYEHRKYNASIKDLQKSIKLDPNNSDVYGVLGMAMFKSKRFQFYECVAEIEKGVQIDPNCEACYLFLYELYKEEWWSAWNVEKCLEITSSLIRISPTNDDYYFERSRWWNRSSHLENILSDLREAISIDEKGAYLSEYSNCLFEYGDYKGAIGILEKLLKIHPEVINKRLAKNYFYLHDFDSTVKYMKREGFSYWWQEDYYMYAYSLSKLGRFEEAIYYYTKGLEEMYPESSTIFYVLLYFGRGFSYKMLGEDEKSGADTRKARDIANKSDCGERIDSSLPPDLRDFGLIL